MRDAIGANSLETRTLGWVASKGEGDADTSVDLSVYDVHVALTAQGAGYPSTASYSTTASWHSTTRAIGGVTYYGVDVQLGPGGALELAEGWYDVYVQVDTSGGDVARVWVDTLRVLPVES